jgi:hypothetical protein
MERHFSTGQSPQRDVAPMEERKKKMQKRTALNGILKFTLKQLQHVSVQSPSSGSALFELAKFTVVKIVS